MSDGQKYDDLRAFVDGMTAAAFGTRAGIQRLAVDHGVDPVAILEVQPGTVWVLTQGDPGDLFREELEYRRPAGVQMLTATFDDLDAIVEKLRASSYEKGYHDGHIVGSRRWWHRPWYGTLYWLRSWWPS